MRARNPYFPSKSQVHPGLPDFTHPHVGLPMAWLGALSLGSSLENLQDVWEFFFSNFFDKNFSSSAFVLYCRGLSWEASDKNTLLAQKRL